MDKSLLCDGSAAVLSQPLEVDSAKTLYWKMLADPPSALIVQRARCFLGVQLARATCLPCDMPLEPARILPWMESRVRQTANAYAEYQAQRAKGQPRRYFLCRAHALYFLRGVAPTKLVDGAWLYGLLAHWREHRFQGLVRTYLEELGEGVPEQNHVLIYRNLLARQGCDDIESLDDECYIQGATQLALGYLARERLPEVIGYNLGYEQLPLHLLICARELAELGIDPHYFRLHVTIDNVSCGHALQAVKALQENLPLADRRDEFLARVAGGYRLNDTGLGTLDVIERFDLEHELLCMLERKRLKAQNMHSDSSALQGCPLNLWLSRPGQMKRLLTALEQRGWIRRNEAPAASRFWQVVNGQSAAMFGVFSPYEKQLIHDWIAGRWLATPEAACRPWRRKRHRASPAFGGTDEFDRDERALKAQLDAIDPDGGMQRLISLMSPAYHYRPAGLLATRLFTAQTR
ncbi:iron-containing redox enzyme family protein [Pseudomonas sp. MAHUQ-62]|uniref:iron-containing redox enzyme family protein n=1 Tax=Pseudomonas sp. GCM10023245 TaxID=3252652 RepID=UPI00361C39FB